MGRGININAFSVMLGFSVLLLSAFPLIRSFGFLIIISLFLCLASSLVLIPAICVLTRPGFLGPYRTAGILSKDSSGKGLPRASSGHYSLVEKGNEVNIAENEMK
jgi:uncharacterized membrane protein YdfJ with MMPL/SSD domain